MNATWAETLWYLVIGAFFFMMIRKGSCGGGHGHKEQKQASNPSEVDHK